MQLQSKHTNVKLDIQTKTLRIAELKIKKDSGEKGVENKIRYKHSETCTEHFTNSLGNRCLKSLPNHTVSNWFLRSVSSILVSIQFLYPKLDIILHHMQTENIDIAFITETWINRKGTCN